MIDLLAVSHNNQNNQVNSLEVPKNAVVENISNNDGSAEKNATDATFLLKILVSTNKRPGAFHHVLKDFKDYFQGKMKYQPTVAESEASQLADKIKQSNNNDLKLICKHISRINETLRKGAVKNIATSENMQFLLGKATTDGSFTNYADLWKSLADDIGNIKTNYLDVFQQLMQKFTSLYQSYIEDVEGYMNGCVKADKDAGKIDFNGGDWNTGLKAFQDAVKKLGNALDPNPFKTTNADPNFITEINKELSPMFTLNKDGTFTIDPSLTDLQDDYTYYPLGVHNNTQGNVTIDTNTYQAWAASMNQKMNSLQSNLQSLAQRYSQANSTYNNINKVLSGSISSTSSMLAQILKNCTA